MAEGDTLAEQWKEPGSGHGAGGILSGYSPTLMGFWLGKGCVLRSQEPGHLPAEQASIYQLQRRFSVNNHRGCPGLISKNFTNVTKSSPASLFSIGEESTESDSVKFNRKFVIKQVIKPSAPSHACHRSALLLFANAKNNHI